MQFRAGPFTSAALLTAVASASLLYLWTARNRARSLGERQERLAALADERTRAIESWIDERKADLKVVAAYAPGADPLPGSPGGAPDAASRAVAGLNNVAQGYRYQRVWLTDCAGEVLAASAGAPPDLSRHPRARTAALAACAEAPPRP